MENHEAELMTDAREKNEGKILQKIVERGAKVSRPRLSILIPCHRLPTNTRKGNENLNDFIRTEEVTDSREKNEGKILQKIVERGAKEVEMEFKYHSHEHPLIFYEAQKGDGQSRHRCRGCGEVIFGPAYHCNQQCLFHLHELCAELPKQIYYNLHTQHPLILFIESPYPGGVTICKVCRRTFLVDIEFNYHCSVCKFDLCISCVLEEVVDYHSHEHPLFPYETHKGDDVSLDICHGCGNGILGPAYHCRIESCYFHLHKICAELPQEIMMHTQHPQHPLRLLRKPPYNSTTCECNVCQGSWDKFTYHCSDCDFNLCLSCVLGKERRIEHQSHQHPLDLLQRPDLFHCDACDTKSVDTSYICISCPFRIHKGCASLQSTIKSSDHDHPLTLAYSLPVKYPKFCKICYWSLRPAHWVYYCDICNYFSHVKCATSKMDPVRGRLSKNNTKAEGGMDSGKKFELPVLPNKYVDLIRQFNMKYTPGKSQSLIKVNHFSHDHPLILFDGQSNNDVNMDEILCDGCVLPISTPFYSCAQCGFFLHKCCAELPNIVSNHPMDPMHPLVLQKNITDIFCAFFCKRCHAYCNGFSFKCDTCDFSLDIQCASLSDTIKHKAHNHVLTQMRRFACTCNACGKFLEESAMGCIICSDFQLCHQCPMLPLTVSHRYDPHPLSLSYPPFKDHPSDDSFCEICEENMDTNLWMYYCRYCDQSFHIPCVYPERLNLKFGETLKHRNHPHVLAVVGETKRQDWCDKCRKYFSLKYAFECVSCNTIFCFICMMRL